MNEQLMLKFSEEESSHDQGVKPRKSEEIAECIPVSADGDLANSKEEDQEVKQFESVEGLLDQMFSDYNLAEAIHRVKRNRGAPGIDGVRVDGIDIHFSTHKERIIEEIRNGRYRPLAVKRVEIPKPDGGVRLLGIPTTTDRILQQALLQVMTPIFDPEFSQNSYGFRPGRSAHDAVRQAKEFIKEGYDTVVDMDLEKFFDRVNHDMLMARVARRIRDKAILKLIRRYLQAGIMLNGVCISSGEGVPQGGPLSPLLANILLDDLDRELEKRGHRFCRYADDCNIYVKTEKAGNRVMESVSNFLEKKLKLKVNRKKSAVDKPSNRKFLGFRFVIKRDVKIRVAPRSIEKLKDRIREITRRKWGISMEERVKILNRYLKGWSGYFALAEDYRGLGNINPWTRHRLRACLWKQWKRKWIRKKKLISLGASSIVAHRAGYSSRGIWASSNTATVNFHISVTGPILGSLIDIRSELKAVRQSW